ncbi:DUF4340 domain-containing protein [Trichormus variabilis]|uniref:DUF4340 domain-containing protein n=1 Tax=Trichormus variabilis SAG 1403-4b TaxID=447716 RepID=A0A3S1CU21_ANAVA|nr:DUF4340 domain-containing protein [Trichormus variabilis]MBD2626086.1 DUF4340 domain-containing protein [Trichormus variabilis FACHB-164]RUS98298.1 hypothetical protein DSM107003_13860 [Trichormus variabilis SAG 1403-4b]
MKRSTLILILLALGLGGFVYFFETKNSTQQEETKEQKQQLFSFAADDIQSLTVKTKDYTLNLERSNKLEAPKWLIKSPISEPANDAIVSYLLDLLVKGKSEKTLSTPLSQLPEFGLDKPQSTIDIKLKNQQTHQLSLGKSNFNKSFLYAQTDPNIQENGKMNLLLVSPDFSNAVNRELSEWKQNANNLESQPLPLLPLPTPTNSK